MIRRPHIELETVFCRRQSFRVPEISRFYGIIIRMFVEPSERHHAAHFHAYY